MLQAFRFFVNNDFLVGHTPGAPLKLPQSAHDAAAVAADAAAPKPTLQELLGERRQWNIPPFAPRNAATE